MLFATIQAMSKITTLNNIAKLTETARKKGATVGLVVGSFDLIHLGHINLFRFAKKHTDVLIVGLDHDQTIKLVKGSNRPINDFRKRAKLLSDLETIDYIFEIKTISHHDSDEAYESYKQIVSKVSPTHIFTHSVCDKHWKSKKELARKNKIVFLLDKSTKITNSGTILSKILQDF